MLEKFLIWSSNVLKRPWVIVSLAALVTIFFALGIPKLRFDGSLKSMLPANNRDMLVKDYYEDESRFGSSEMIFVGVEAEDIYAEKTLLFVKGIKDKIEALNKLLPVQNMASLLHLDKEESQTVVEALRGVGINVGNYTETLIPLISSPDKLRSAFSWNQPFASKVAEAASKVDPRTLFDYYEAPIDKAQCLVNADYIANEDDALVVKKLVEKEEITAANIDGLKKRVASWDYYNGVLVSSDGKLTTILVSLTTDNSDVKGSLNQGIEGILKAATDPAFKTYLDGEPVINEMLSRQMLQDTSTLLPLAILVVLSILFLCFRSLRGVVYPAAIILFSVVGAMGLMAYCNVPISTVSTTIPVLLVAIVSAYCIHQMNHYLLDPEADKLAVFNRNMKNVGLAITLSGITVMVGFGVLIAQDLVPMKNFGIFTAIGDLFGVIGALYLLPSLVMTSNKPKKPFNMAITGGWIGAILQTFVRINKKGPRIIVLGAIAISAVFFIGAFGVKTEINNVAFFKKGNPVRVADERLNEKLAGTVVLNVILDSDLRDPVTRSGGSSSPEEAPVIATPAVLNEIDAFDRDIRAQFPYVTKVLSFNDVVKKMNQEMNGGGKEFYSIPQSKELISQYLLIFSGDIKSVLSDNRDKLRINVTMKRVSSEELDKVRAYCAGYFSKDFLGANHIQAQVSGAANLASAANTLLVKGMYTSIVLCVLIVFMLLLYILRDARMSLIAITPIFVTLFINFGVLGFFHIPLNIGTAIVSTIAIGIGVDYSIHFITWYRNELRKEPDIRKALELTIVNKGRAILYNMFVIFGGFFVLIFSKFVPLVQLGYLVAVCMVATAVGSLVVVPAIIRLLAKKDRKFLSLGVKRPE